jgi:hypothetical protein
MGQLDVSNVTVTRCGPYSGFQRRDPVSASNGAMSASEESDLILARYVIALAGSPRPPNLPLTSTSTASILMPRAAAYDIVANTTATES